MIWLKAARDQRNYREIALLWLVVSSLLGLGGLMVGSLAAIWTQGDFQDGLISPAVFTMSAAIYLSLAAGPAAGWALYAGRRYWPAMVAAAPPILLALLTAPNLVG
jgi:hypothetical protein